MIRNAPFNEDELLPALQRGETAALRQVYSLYLRQLCFFTEQITSDTLAAEDIASEAFIKVFQRKGDFLTLDRLKAFLFTTARNAALDYLKAEKRHHAVHNRIDLVRLLG